MSSPASLKHASEGAAIGAQVAKAVAWVSGIFSLVACISLIVNQIQVMQVDPLNDKTLKALKAQIPKDLNNQQLRESVRNLSLMTRRSFFTNQTMMRATGLMLLFGVAIFLASMKTYVELRLRLPVPQGQAPREGGGAERASHRWAVSAGAGVIVVLTLLLVFISPPDFDLMTVEKTAEETAAAAETKVAAPEAKAAPKEGPAGDKQPGEGAKPVPATAGSAALPLHAWPMLRGPNGLGIAAHTDVPKEWDGKTKKNVKWVVPVPKPGFSSPIVWDKLIFVTGGDEEGRSVYAFHSDTGKPAWEGRIGSTGPGGIKKPTPEVGYCTPTMATDGERVFAIAATGEINAFTMDGKPAWPGNLGAPKVNYGYGSSLLAYGGRVYVQYDGPGGGRLVALDGKTGKKIWDKPRAGLKSSWSTPVLATVASKPQLILSGDPFAMGHDPATGEAIWKFNWTEDASVEVAPSPAFANGIAYFTTNRAALVAVKPGEEKPLWRYDEDQPDIPSPVATEKFVILAGGSPVVTCLDAVKGTKLWTHDFDDGFEASPVVAGDLVYFLDKKGVMFVLKLSEKYEQVARNELGEDSSCTPAFLPGRLYLRSKTSLYCISKD